MVRLECVKKLKRHACQAATAQLQQLRDKPDCCVGLQACSRSYGFECHHEDNINFYTMDLNKK